MHSLGEIVASHFNYIVYVAIMMVGLYAMAAKRNLIKKLIGLGIFQTSIMLLYVSIGAKKGATIPILAKGATTVNAGDYINPLPHVLMLTAIVVSVATLGVALALVQKIYKNFKSIEEDEILKELRR
ncbi:cation:proton antiporter subunit C [Pseudodesulfovibrio senegalensis]|jgi:multicomponent Na+:H+ antiporter subunit C|uniref:Cation:proton antiporter subunit C n=1 Tax=Pseudodesulfovibrio senegalensis TaxID=1721087 RepID=A0A6N6N5V2_9BACT|nr:cation:proton antiporter subunit C [Pseudodesulfovibrio senegalensis]KAB1442859.1 cation:proton antiporter subunit C [Pseudodesulfovibrio senegalensis]